MRQQESSRNDREESSDCLPAAICSSALSCFETRPCRTPPSTLVGAFSSHSQYMIMKAMPMLKISALKPRFNHQIKLGLTRNSRQIISNLPRVEGEPKTSKESQKPKPSCMVEPLTLDDGRGLLALPRHSSSD